MTADILAAAAAAQVKNAAGQWVDAPPVPGTFVCNIGDMFKVSVCHSVVTAFVCTLHV